MKRRDSYIRPERPLIERMSYLHAISCLVIAAATAGLGLWMYSGVGL